MRKIKIAIMLCGVVAGGLVAGAPTAANAATVTRKFHVSSCVAAPTVPANSAVPVFNSVGQVANTDAGKYLELWCPLVSDPAIGAPGNAPSVKVHVFSNGCAPGDSVGVSTSVGFLPASGGPAVFGGFSAPGNCTPGVYELSPGANLGSSSDYPFLRVFLRKFHSGSANVMFGYTLSVTQ